MLSSIFIAALAAFPAVMALPAPVAELEIRECPAPVAPTTAAPAALTTSALVEATTIALVEATTSALVEATTSALVEATTAAPVTVTSYATPAYPTEASAVAQTTNIQNTNNWEPDVTDNSEHYNQYCPSGGVISCCNRGSQDNGGLLGGLLGNILGGDCGAINVNLLASQDIHQTCGQQQASCCQGDTDGNIDRDGQCNPVQRS